MAESDLVQSLLRGMEILMLVGESTDGLRLKDIADAMGLKTPTVHNLVKTLAHRRFIERDGGGRYHLGIALNDLARIEQAQGFQQQAEATLLALGEAMPWATLTWAERTDGQIRARYRVSPDYPGVLEQPERQIFGLYGSASGLVTLAFATEDDRLALMERHPFYEHGVALWGTLENLDAYLTRVREQGFAVLPFPEPFFRMAVPVYRAKTLLRGALGVSFRGERAEEAESQAGARVALLEASKTLSIL